MWRLLWNLQGLLEFSFCFVLRFPPLVIRLVWEKSHLSSLVSVFMFCILYFKALGRWEFWGASVNRSHPLAIWLKGQCVISVYTSAWTPCGSPSAQSPSAFGGQPAGQGADRVSGRDVKTQSAFVCCVAACGEVRVTRRPGPEFLSVPWVACLAPPDRRWHGFQGT